MQTLKRVIKKVAAISVGAAMLGATLTSALAADLGTYPKPFDGSDAAIIIGSSLDSAASSDIAFGLPKETPAGKVVGQVKDDIPLGMSIANSTSTGFDVELDNDDISSFQDVSVSFQSNDYDARDVLLLSKGYTGPRVATSLTSGSAVEDDYEDNVFLEVGASDKVKYFYAFDDSINVSKASTSKPLEIKFLGKTLKITSVDTTDLTKFTAYVGTEYFMNVGDTVTVEGKKVKLDNVGSGGAILISVDGVVDTISSGNSKVVNGIEIANDETFYEDNKAQRAAALVIGEDAQRTYKDGEPYVGEDETDPDWVWDTGNLADSATTIINQTAGGVIVSGSDPNAGPHIGIENDFVMNDAGDNPPGIGECVELPNNYAAICLDSLTIKDEDYIKLTIEYESSIETSKSGQSFGGTGQGGIHIKSSGDDTLLIKSGNLTINANSSQDRKTNEIWLALSNDTVVLEANNDTAGEVAVYYRDSDKSPTMQYAGKVRLINSTIGNAVFRLNYGKTKEDRLIAYLHQNKSFGGIFANLKLQARGSSTTELTDDSDNIMINFSTTSGNISSLGRTASSEEAGELSWATNGLSVVSAALGAKDENHRTRYGIIIEDPKSNGASDRVTLKIPNDQQQANVIVKGITVESADGAKNIAASLMATEVTDLTQYNAILVGGPCANSLTAKVMGASTDFPACANGFKEGEAILELKANGDKWALIAAGYTADDTRRAGIVLKSVGQGEEKFLLAGTSKTVKGTSLDVSAIDVV